MEVRKWLAEDIESKSNMIMTVNKYRDKLRNHAEEILRTLEEFKNLSNINLENKKLKESIKNTNTIIYRGLDCVKRNIDFIIANVEWDTFNIAFFGETNAGKSTLIEALRKGDGSSIGEGYKDYTKRLKKIEFNNKINFFDMPGIEGKEGKLEIEIKKSVGRSHIVFYVIGTNKEPEKGTLEKVKHYLKDRAKVYSILNVRGKPTVYKYKKKLIDENIKKIEKRSKLKFKKILNGHYRGNIILNAYIGFLSEGRPKRRDFRKDRYKIEEVFGNNKKSFMKKIFISIRRRATKEALEKAYLFSNLGEIEKLIQNLFEYAPKEIVVSNTYKFLKTLEDIISNISKENENFNSSIRELNKLVEVKKEESKGIIEKYQKEIQNAVELKIDNMEWDLKSCAYKGIDEGWSKRDLSRRTEKIQNQYKVQIKKEVYELLNEMKKEIQNYFIEFTKQIKINLKFINLKGNIDIEKIFQKIQADFKYVFGQIADVSLSIWAIIDSFLIHPILGVIVTLLVCVRKIFEWFFVDPKKRKRKAKQQAYDDIKKNIEKLKREIKSKMENEYKRLRKNIKEKIEEMDLYIKELEQFSLSMSKNIKKLNDIKLRIDTLLAKYILGNNVKSAYIDLQLDKVLVIGCDFNKNNMKVFRIKNIYTYKSLKDFLESVDHTIENKILILKEQDEFIYRCLVSFSDKLNLKDIRRMKV